jgi:hypothetical protein
VGSVLWQTCLPNRRKEKEWLSVWKQKYVERKNFYCIFFFERKANQSNDWWSMMFVLFLCACKHKYFAKKRSSYDWSIDKSVIRFFMLLAQMALFIVR